MQRPRAWVERHLALAGFAAFALVSGLVRLADYAEPLGADPAQFLYVGETIGQGGMPYADAVYSKGPLTALLFALFDPLVGTSPAGVRLTVIPFAALAALALAGYVAHHAGRAAGLLAGLLCAVGSVVGAGAETEEYGIAPMFGALWLATRPGTAATAGAGALVGCAVLLNPALGLVALPVAAELWLGTPRGARARRYLAAASGALVPVAMAAVWLAAGGALDDSLTQIGAQIRSASVDPAVHPLEQQRSGRGGGGSISLPDLRGNLPAAAAWALAFVACGAAARDSRLRPAAVVMALALGAVLLRVKLATYEFDYQYYPAIPAMAGAIALGAASIWPHRALERIALTAVIVALPLVALVVWAEDKGHLDAGAPLERVAPAEPGADYLRDHTSPAEPVFVAGGRADVYWLAERRAPTRYFDAHGLRSLDDVAERDRALARNPPAAVAVLGPNRLGRDPGLERLVRERGYVLAYDRKGSRVWLRRSVKQ